MTYGELKQKVRDLGFEEDSTMTEYSTIVMNATNKSMQLMFDDIVMYLVGYYTRTLSTEEVPWTPTRPTYLTADSPDSTVLELPDNIIELLPLLTSYFVWLDDDQVKATMYWNTFDTMRENIIRSCANNVKATITGGIGW